MSLSSLLRLTPGVTAIIGGGGKTTLMNRLARELPGRVIVCTSTRIRRPPDLPVLTHAEPDSVREALAQNRILCVGETAEKGKLSASVLPFEALSALADYVLVEADGSKGLPLKAHAPWEPVIPAHASQTILVAGLDGLERPIRESCHRPERYAALAGAQMETPVMPGLAARVIRAEGLGDRVFLNKAEGIRRQQLALELSRLLKLPVVSGSLFEEEYQCLS